MPKGSCCQCQQCEQVYITYNARFNNVKCPSDEIPLPDAYLPALCFAVASYCAEFNLSYEFISRGYPVVATIDGCKYQITKQFTTRYRVNLWVLRCKEID